MKRAEKKITAATKGATARDARTVPLMVPHGCAVAGRDFESAFDLLRCDQRVRELWRRERAKASLARAS
jgi:hypothetical protein